jgi:hypothetical protein
MPTYDFFSPMMSTAIVAKDGTVVPLWTNTHGDNVENPNAASIKRIAGITSIPYVTSIRITVGLACLPIITITLTPPYEDAIKLLDSEFLDWSSCAIRTQVGYTGKDTILSPVFTGFMLQPAITFGSQISITLNAQGPFSVFSNEKSVIFPGTHSSKEILEQALRGKKDHPRPAVGPDNVIINLSVDWSEVDKDPQVKKIWEDPKTNTHYADMTDWDIIDRLCRECRSWFMINNSKLVVVPNKNFESEKPARVFHVYGAPNGTFGDMEYPAFHVTSNYTGNLLPGTLDSLRAEVISYTDKTITSYPITAKSIKASLVGDKEITFKDPNISSAKADLQIKDPGSTLPNFINTHGSKPESLKLVESRLEQITSKQGPTCTVDTIGIPDLFPGEIVELRGCSLRLNGAYIVQEFTHNFNSSGFTTSLTLNTAALKVSKESAEPTANTNDSKAKSSEDTGKPKPKGSKTKQAKPSTK